MSSWALILPIGAIIAGVPGFSGIAGTAVVIEKLLFVAFLVLFVAGPVLHVVRGPPPPLCRNGH